MQLWERSMKLDNPRSTLQRQIAHAPNDLVAPFSQGPGGSLQQRVIICSEHIGPRQTQQAFVKRAGLMLSIREHLTQMIEKDRTAEGCLKFLCQPKCSTG